MFTVRDPVESHPASETQSPTPPAPALQASATPATGPCARHKSGSRISQSPLIPKWESRGSMLVPHILKGKRVGKDTSKPASQQTNKQTNKQSIKQSNNQAIKQSKKPTIPDKPLPCLEVRLDVQGPALHGEPQPRGNRSQKGQGDSRMIAATSKQRKAKEMKFKPGTRPKQCKDMCLHQQVGNNPGICTICCGQACSPPPHGPMLPWSPKANM